MDEDARQALIGKIAQVMRWNGAPGDRARGALFTAIDGGDGSCGMQMKFWSEVDGARKYDFLRAKNGLDAGDLAMELRRAMQADGDPGWRECTVTLDAAGAPTLAFEY